MIILITVVGLMVLIGANSSSETKPTKRLYFVVEGREFLTNVEACEYSKQLGYPNLVSTITKEEN